MSPPRSDSSDRTARAIRLIGLIRYLSRDALILIYNGAHVRRGLGFWILTTARAKDQTMVYRDHEHARM